MFVSESHEGVRGNRMQFDTVKKKKAAYTFDDNRVVAIVSLVWRVNCVQRHSDTHVVYVDNEGTMKPFPHTVFNISITCATQKNEVCQIQNSIFVQYIWIRSEITVLLLQEMVISCKLCTNNSQSKCQNIKVLYKSASQVQWMQNIYTTEGF